MPYELSEDVAARLLKALRWYERRKDTGPDGATADGGARNRQLIRVNTFATVEGAFFTYYGSTVVQWDAESAAFIELGECYLVCDSNTPLETDKFYFGMQAGNHSDGTPVFVTSLACCDITPPATVCEDGTELCVCVSNVKFYYKIGVGQPPDLFDEVNKFYDFPGPECHTLTLTGAPAGGVVGFDDYPVMYPAVGGPFAGLVSGGISIGCFASPSTAVALSFNYGIGGSLGYITWVGNTFPTLASIITTFVFQGEQTTGSSNWYGHKTTLTISDGAC